MNTWKRAFALLLCLCITLSMVPAPAGATEGPSITANDTEVYQGNYAYVYIYANNLNDLASIDLEIFYDSEAMQLNNQWTGGLFENSVVSVNTATPGVVRLSAASFSGISGSGDLLTLVFQINSDCPPGDYPVTVAVGEAYDMALQHVHMSGTVSNIRVMERSNSGSSGTPFYLYTSADRTNLYQGETATIWLYNSSGNNLASATFTAEYDSELFELVSVNLGSNLMVEGAIYSINDRIPGLVQIIYACPTEVYAYDLMSLTLRAKENTNESSSVTFKIADAYNGSLETYGNYECNRWLYLQESQIAEDLPDLFLETEQMIVGQQSNATLSLQADAPVAAGDFLLSYDPSVIRCVSVTASADVAANGGMIVINPFYTEGKIRFSYLNESGYDGGLELIQIVWEPVSSPDLHYCVTMSGMAVVDVHYNSVELDYVTETDCIYGVFNYDPTCTEPGQLEYRCMDCLDGWYVEQDPALGHDHVASVIAPTCTEQGCDAHICSRCGDAYYENYTDALGHDFGEWYSYVASGCSYAGEERRDCSRCDAYESRDLPLAEHTWCEWYVTMWPTCMSSGTEERYCTECYIYEYREMPITDHAWCEWYVTMTPTCMNSGTEARYCTWCYAYEYRELPMTDHTWCEWYVTMWPTCTESGWEERYCDWCYIYESRELPALGHNYYEYVWEPSCESGGYTEYCCEYCGDSYYDNYTDAVGHNWGEWTLNQEPNCMESGWEERYCDRCGEYDYQELPMTDHTWCEWYVTMTPTCMNSGTEARYCTWCYTYEYRELPMTDHNYLEYVTEPGCESGGYTEYCCEYCGDSYYDNYTDALGHGYGEWYAVTVTTCTEDGEYRRDCGRCEHYETMVMPAYGHNYESVVTEATCTMGGYTTHVCSNCGHSYANSYTEALGHAYGEWYGISAATCIAAGMERRDCQRCDHYEEREIPALAHSYSDAVRTEPTCTELGTLTYTCTACGGSYTEEIPALGHAYGEWYAVTVTTCTEDGEYRRDCGRCEHYEIMVMPAYGHNYESVVTEPTCTMGGYTTHTCGNCGHSYVNSYTEALGHAYGEWYGISAATCIAAGMERRDCQRCDHYEEREIPALAHSYSDAVRTEPTCTEPGTLTYTCTACGGTYTEEIPALGHDWQAADCDSPRTCGRCGLTDGEILGHEYGEWFVVEEATCTEPGRELRECIRCDAHETREVAPIGHNYESVVTEATCVAGGYTTHTCTNCGHSYIDGETAIDPENHVGQEGTECECGVFLGGSAVPDSWLEDNGLWYYYREGQKVTGWLQLGSIWYFMDADGVMQTGWLLDGGVWYYLNNHMMTGWQQIGGAWYYFGANGVMQSGWLLDGGVWYYLNNHMMTGWQQIGGAWYYFDGNGAMQSGWLLDGGVWYYLNNHMQTGWQQIDGVWYYFDGNGAMQSGWLWNGGVWYYLGNYMATGWQQIGGAWYYFDANGAMQSGWLLDGGVWYYLNNHMQTGWQQIGGAWYYFAGNGAMQSGWLWNGGVWYYLNNHMQTGWQQIGGVWYYFNANGAMQSGWQQIGGKWYYLNNHMITGWLNLGGVWYYLDPTGAMVTGSYVIDGVTYYFDESGVWIP